MRPIGLESTGVLSAGDVGYLTASIKNVKDTRVGDTVTHADNPVAQPLPGYRPAVPMVFSGIYPLDGAKYEDLREALEKLQLNDASLLFEPETRLRLALAFAAAFWACCTWKSSSSASSGDTTWSSSPRPPASSTASPAPTARS